MTSSKRPRPLQAMQQLLDKSIASHRANQLGSAEKGYVKVLKAWPTHPVALNLLGVIALSKGQNERAISLLQKSVAAKPDFADAYNHLGIVLRKLGRHEEAGTMFRRAVRFDRGLYEAHNNLGNLHKDRANYQDAAISYKKAIALNPKSFEPRYNLGNAYRELEQLDLAIKAYREALLENPNSVETWFNLADLLERQYQLKDAHIAVTEALSRAPAMASASILRAKILRRTGDELKAAELLEALDLATLAPEQAISAAFELGKIYDSIGQSRKAFAQFCRGNNLQRTFFGKGVDDEAQQFREGIADIIKQMQAGLHKSRNERATNDNPDPVFLIGFPRSGTTLLDQVLDGHSKIDVMEERQVVAELISEIKTSGTKSLVDFTMLNTDEIEDIRKGYFQRVSKFIVRQPGNTLIDKMPLNIIHVPFLAIIFPQAKYVFALRHPLDVVLSNFTQMFKLNAAMANFLDLQSTAKTYVAVMSLWEKCCASFPLHYHTVRYEYLVENMERETKPLFQFLELEWEPGVVDTAGHARRRKVINTPSYEQVVLAVHKNSIGRWQNYRAELEPVMDRLKPFVKTFAYEIIPTKSSGE